MVMKTLTLPFSPSVNNYYCPVRNGPRLGIKLRKCAKEYRKRVVGMLRNVGHPLEGRLHVIVTLNPPKEMDFDLDNRMKGLLDALEHSGVFNNDNQIDHLEIIRGKPVSGGNAIVKLGVL